MHSYRIRFACLGALVALTGLRYAEAQKLGATGPNNNTTPTITDGDITIHYVTVGEIENTFQVHWLRGMDQVASLTYLSSRIALMLLSET